ncbi:hypothetical protein DGG96_03570 [Legionella qingyii]|uniref:Uncharacterized protein n=1 Tax=Legionella qingyii TaxID=2184757 RepID=A0A317U8P5_9GAMM|nr:hypothetical protein DGG96_03570 [Legionella qingyii]
MPHKAVLVLDCIKDFDKLFSETLKKVQVCWLLERQDVKVIFKLIGDKTAVALGLEPSVVVQGALLRIMVRGHKKVVVRKRKIIRFASELVIFRYCYRNFLQKTIRCRFSFRLVY